MSKVYTALVTPFKEADRSIDYNSLNSILKSQLDAGITGGLFFGSTGEGRTITYGEKLNLLSHVLSIRNYYKSSDVPFKHILSDKWTQDQLEKLSAQMKILNYQIIVGVGGDCTEETIKFAKQCKKIGCDQIMVTVPAYNKPNQTGIYEHFKAIAIAVQNETHEIIEKKVDGDIDKELLSEDEKNKTITGMPILMYNIPSRTGANMCATTIAKLRKEFPHIYGIKEASGSIDKVWEIMSLCDIDIFAGDDTMYIPVTAMGGCGVVSVLSNVLPDVMVAIRDKGSKKFHFDVYHKVKTMFCDTNPIAVKYAMAKKGIISSDTLRLPLTKLQEDKQKIVDSAFDF